MGAWGATKITQPCKHYSRTQRVDIRHGNSAMRLLSVTESCHHGGAAGESERAVGCQAREWMVPVTEQRNEIGEGGGGIDRINVETIGNCMCV